MKKINRLLDNNDFKAVIDSRNKLFCDAFNIFYLKNTLGYLRVGISVSKKVGNAVVRNKVKRQIRTFADKDFLITDPLDVVVVAKPSYLKFDYNENYKSFHNLITKMKRRITDEKETN